MATTFVVDHRDAATSTAQRLVVWARHDKRIRTTHTGDGDLAFIVPDELAAAVAAGGYGPTVELSPTVDATITPGTPQTVSGAWDVVTGIDPNTYANEAPAVTGFTATPIPAAGGSRQFLRLTWTYDQPHTTFVLRSRPSGTTTPWHEVRLAPYERQYDFYAAPGSAWEFRIQAIPTDRHYVPVASPVSAVVTGSIPANPADIPAAPTGLAAETITATGLTLSWTAAASGATPTSYSVRYRTTPSGAWSTPVSVPHVDGTTDYSLPVTGLTAETEYEFEVTPMNGTIAGTAATTTATTIAA